MKSIRLLKKRLISCEVNFTPYIENALWLLPDGSMIDGNYEYGVRSEDHRIIECGVTKYNRYDGEKFWNEAHYQYNLVRLVPETGFALVAERQKLTDIQQILLSNSGYKIETYLSYDKLTL